MIILVCLKIFFARIIDVSLGTIRTILVVRGERFKGAMIAFFEVFVWFLVAREALNTDINSILIPIFYAGGYSCGTLLGSIISNKFINSIIGVQAIVSEENSPRLIEEIRKNGFGISVVELKKSYDEQKKDMLIIELNRLKLKELTKIIRSIEPNAFVIINDTKYVQNGLLK